MIKNKKMVVALGGNAILSSDPSAEGQQEAVLNTAKSLANIIAANNQLVITHGNGPQVGNLLLQQKAADSDKNPAMPLDTCVSMTQGSIGYWIQQAMDNVLKSKGIDKNCATVISQTLVSVDDPAFQNPTKPIGPFYTEAEIEKVRQNNPSLSFVEDAGRGYRQVVASPEPLDVIESNIVETMLDNNMVPVAVGGGGIPVIKENEQLVGVPAVIDKDFASEKLAELINADELIILTAVSNVYINFNQPNETKLQEITVSELEKLSHEGHFAKGSMLPKVTACINFVKATGKKAVITSLDNLPDYLENGSGTVIKP